MASFVIEESGEIKEVFHYEMPLLTQSYQALEEYARANYGAAAVLREMSEDEEARFLLDGPAGLGILDR